ncbi:putative uv-damaged dna-binding protein [Diaporthe ampelina]|uniref:Putative uv-damaged dna-binding protein n=1 Tax=Diaporthe ampelina TaxID=1214573 RepID=A0A0G2FVT2_9PEZI|nr:putative uv-damaged dna-binding protein [Diaporthe ampelina]
MAIYSAVPPPPALQSQPTAHSQNASQQQPPAASGPIDIEAWTTSALESLSVSPTATGTTGRPLAIPLDEHTNAQPASPRVAIATADGAAHPTTDAVTPPRRPPSRRDSLRRRELVLKGKEGSRQRRRYDMKRLTDVPNVEPPEPRDWEPRPVYPIHHVPYHVAAFWERGLSQQAEARKNTAARRRAPGAGSAGAGRVPRELRDTVKRTPGVKGWLRALEEPVREFLAERHRAAGEAPVAEDESDESDDEVVFVGRKTAGSAPAGGPRGDTSSSSSSSCCWKSAHREVRGDGPAVDRGMVFDSSPEDDDGSSAFKRWLTHSISDYYGLVSRSVTVGSPGRRCVYVGVRDVDLKIRTALPRPLWELF